MVAAPPRKAHTWRSGDLVVINWGRLPPPVGGVTRTTKALHDALLQGGTPSVVLNPRPRVSQLFRTLRQLRRRDAVSLVHLSQVRSARGAFLLALLSRHYMVAFVHAGTPEEMERLAHSHIARAATAVSLLPFNR